jgi:signal transduction histidine kinase
MMSGCGEHEVNMNERTQSRIGYAPEPPAGGRLRLGLRAKVILLGAGMLIPLAAITWFIAVESLRRNMTQEFTSKGVSIAESLANSAVDPILTRDASTDQALVDQYVGTSGVAYVLVYDSRHAIIAHTFVPRVPPALIEQHRSAGTQAKEVRETRYADPVTGVERRIIDAGVPMLAGRLGVVHVGMDEAIISAAAARAGNYLLLAFAGIAALSTAAAALFARRVTRPLTRLTQAATRVGRGDLSESVPITSRDEVGLLTATFNDTVVRLRSLVQTEAERDQLRKLTEELKALAEVGRAVNSTLDLDAVLHTIISRASQLAATEGGLIYEYDDATNQLRLRAVQNFEEDLASALRAKPLRKGEGVGGRVVETRAPFQVPDITAEGAYQVHIRDVLVSAGYRALLAVPLIREERVIGAFLVGRKQPGEFSHETVELLTTFASQSALAIENARLFRQLEQKSRELEEASRHKSQFLANMSHELRTPLNAIIGFSEVLHEQMFGDLNEKQADYISDIHSSGQHLLSLINDILDLSKIEAGHIELSLGEFDLPAAIENAVTVLKERAARHGVRLEVDVDKGLGSFYADERKFKQILLNLLSNAVKFTPEGGRVRLSAEQVKGELLVSVNDSGVGIAESDQELIFEEFRQVATKDQNRPEGTGLGLALTKKFVEMHHGRIWVRSEPGKGSTFAFTLPYNLKQLPNSRQS